MQEKITFKNRQAQVLAGVLHKPEGRKARAWENEIMIASRLI